MSKLARTLAAAALAAAALAVPSTADAATRAVVEIAYTKTASGYDAECAAQAVGAGVAYMTSCYVSTATGSPQLCWSVSVSDLLGYTTWSSGPRCTVPTVAVDGVGGAGVYRA